MKRHKHKPPALKQDALSRAERAREFAKLVIHIHANGLKRSRRWVRARPLPPTQCGLNRLGKIERRREGAFVAALAYRSCNAAGLFLFAEPENQIGEIFLAELCDNIRRAWAGATHTHIERTVTHERKTAFRLVQLK